MLYKTTFSIKKVVLKNLVLLEHVYLSIFLSFHDDKNESRRFVLKNETWLEFFTKKETIKITFFPSDFKLFKKSLYFNKKECYMSCCKAELLMQFATRISETLVSTLARFKYDPMAK